MTIFKTFLKILNRNKGVLIMYSIILIVVSTFGVKSNETTMNFESTKPDIYIINHDTSALSNSLVKYLAGRNNVVDLADAEAQGKADDGNPADADVDANVNANAANAEADLDAEALSDALFYRRVNLIIEIPADFGVSFLAGRDPAITYRSTGDYNAELAKMSVSRYLETAGAYLLLDNKAPDLIARTEQTLNRTTPVELTLKENTGNVAEAAFYYNFLNYSLIAGGLFMICLILLSFRTDKVAMRIKVSSVNPARVNRILLLANLLFALALWAVYVGISFIIVGSAMWSLRGVWFILNSLVFTCCITALAFLIGNIVHSRNALNGLVNVVGLGSSFICGAFVPLQWLPDSVKVIAHILPSYWYIDANEKIKVLENFDFTALWPIIFNMMVVGLFTIGFVIVTNLISRHQQRK